MPAPHLTDFKKHRKHRSYLLRPLGDNGTGSGTWVEVVRADGFGFGAMYAHLAEQVIEADKANPVAPTGYKLEDLFPSEATEPDPEPEADPAE